MNEAFRNLIFKKEMLCILYFITVPGVYKLNKTLHAAACFPVHDEQKGPGCCILIVTKAAAAEMHSGRLHLGAPFMHLSLQMFLLLVFTWAFLASEDHVREGEAKHLAVMGKYRVQS